MKRSYNPFKMWGSLIGVTIFTFIYIFFDISKYPLLMELSFASLGFIIGWGINSLVQYLGRK